MLWKDESNQCYRGLRPALLALSPLKTGSTTGAVAASTPFLGPDPHFTPYSCAHNPARRDSRIWVDTQDRITYSLPAKKGLLITSPHQEIRKCPMSRTDPSTLNFLSTRTPCCYVLLSMQTNGIFIINPHKVPRREMDFTAISIHARCHSPGKYVPGLPVS